MPFNEAGNSTYAHLSEVLKKKEYYPLRIDMNPGSIAIMNKIMNEIITSNFIIVDISGQNPNVFYELGIAHTFKESRNVIIIKNEDTKAPSDISHINYIEYSSDNYLLLCENVIKTLDEMSYITELSFALTATGILEENYDDDFMIQIENKFSQMEIREIASILNGDDEDISDAEINDLIRSYEKFLRDIAAINMEEKKRSRFFSLYINIFVKSRSNTVVSNRLQEIFSGDKIVLDNNLDLSLKTDVALKFLDFEKCLNIVVPWVIEYFSRSKSTHIDLNRYKIEAFLLNQNDSRYDEYVVAALNNKDRHIREHMADIVGEKRILQAISRLKTQLSIEDNIYTAASIMEAIGKIGTIDDIDDINEWIENNKDRINNPGGNFVFKHAYNAIFLLSVGEPGTFVSDYLERYGEYFTH